MSGAQVMRHLSMDSKDPCMTHIIMVWVGLMVKVMVMVNYLIMDNTMTMVGIDHSLNSTTSMCLTILMTNLKLVILIRSSIITEN